MASEQNYNLHNTYNAYNTSYNDHSSYNTYNTQPKFSTLYQSNKQYLYKIYKSLFTLKQTDPQPNVFIDDDTMKEFVRNDLRLMFQDEQIGIEQKSFEEKDAEGKGFKERDVEQTAHDQTPTNQTPTSNQTPIDQSPSKQRRTLEQLTNVLQLNIFKMQFISPFTKNILIIGTNHLFNIRILTKFVSKEQEKIIEYLQGHSADNNTTSITNNCDQK